MIKDDIYQTHLTAQQNLRRLSIIRGVALLGQFLALVFFRHSKPNRSAPSSHHHNSVDL